MTRKIVIIGGGAAGPKTAAKLRREDKDCIIEMYTQENNVSYSACGLPYFIGDVILNLDDLLVRSAEEFEKDKINVFLKMKAIKIYPNNKIVIFEDLNTSEKKEVNYDILVLATGARPYIPNIENAHYDNVFCLRNLEDGIKIKESVNTSKTVTLIGLGFIGFELLEAFIRKGLRVQVIDKNPYILSMFDDDISEMIQNYVIKRDGDKITFYNDEFAIKFIGENNQVSKVVTTRGHEIETDFVIIAAGIVPNSELAADAGLKLGVNNSIWVNSHLKTSCPNIYAVGDCCEKIQIVTKRPCWIPLGSTANKEGRCAAINIANQNCDFEGVLGAAVSKYFDFTVCMTGITEREAKSLGYEVMTTIVTDNDRTGYMPEAKLITIKLVIDINSREILGVQAIGKGDAEKRVSTISLAIMEGIKITEFTSLDLPYAPPYSTAIDPLIKAIYITKDKIDKLSS